MIRVLLVEDSATMRHHLRESLAADPELQVVGEAVDGEQAVELVGRLRPDVVTMDMMLPTMSGLVATEHIMAEHPTPILVVSSADRQELFSTYNALAAGAVDVLEKPRGDDTDADWGRRLRSAVRLVSRIRVITHPRARLDGRGRPHAGNRRAAAGRSTRCGWSRWARPPAGRGALTDLLRALPPGFRPPVLCVQHIAASEPFAVAFSDWLAGQTGRDVSYARDGTPSTRWPAGWCWPRRTGTCWSGTGCCGSATGRPGTPAGRRWTCCSSRWPTSTARRRPAACSPGWAGTAPRACCGCGPAGR